MYSSAYVWAKVLSHMEERLGAVTVSAWFDDAEVVELNENNLILYSPSDFRREIIRRRCTDYIQDALKEVFNSDAKLMVFGDEELDAFKQKGKSVSSMDFNPQFTFDNFVVGPSNRFAHSAAIAVSKTPGQVYNPLFLYGPPGVGKTHLLYAIAKIAGLKMCESFNLQYGTNYIAVMPTNLYGPNDNFDLERSHVLPAMIRKIHLAHCLKQGDWDAICKDLNQRPVEGIDGNSSKEDILTILAKYGISNSEVKLWGTGTPLREFLWSEEMADASVFVMEHVDFKDTYKQGDKDIRNCHINIGTGKEISIRELAELIVSTVGYQGQLTFDSTKPDGTMRKLTDPSKLHALGWHHKVEIEEGVQRMYNWYLGR